MESNTIEHAFSEAVEKAIECTEEGADTVWSGHMILWDDGSKQLFPETRCGWNAEKFFSLLLYHYGPIKNIHNWKPHSGMPFWEVFIFTWRADSETELVWIIVCRPGKHGVGMLAPIRNDTGNIINFKRIILFDDFALYPLPGAFDGAATVTVDDCEFPEWLRVVIKKGHVG